MQRLRGLNPYVLALGLAATVAVMGAMWYSNRLVDQLAQKEERLVRLWASAIQFVANPGAGDDAFVFNHLIRDKIIPVPAITTDEEGQPQFLNLEVPANLHGADSAAFVARRLQAMRTNPTFRPIRIEFLPGRYQYIYYDETEELKRLRIFPFLSVGVIVLFTLAVVANVYVSQRNAQNRIWAGLARETAHQLGTPLSGLLAWLELLKDQLTYLPKPQHGALEPDTILAEMEQDVAQLQTIAERFSKIGSEPERRLTPLHPLVAQATAYVQARASRKVSLTLNSTVPPSFALPLNPTLMGWVIEVLLKNALDALPDQTGQVTLTLSQRAGMAVLDVADTGRGIAPRHLRRVFRPGFTTKKRGWGLGLSLAKRIVERYHGGSIYVKRSELGKGTTFRIELPVKQSRYRLKREWLD